MIKIKNDKTVPAIATLTLLMITLLFKEIPIPAVTAAPPGTQPPDHVPTPSKPQKSSKVDSSVESVKGDNSTPGSQPNGHVPTPPQQHNADSSIGASAAAAGGYSSCSPSSQCNSHVPTPGCCSRQSKKVEPVRVNASKDEGLIRKHGPVDHTYY